jgi:hypothetical protein
MAIDMIEQNELGALAPSRVGNDRCFVDEKSKNYLGFTGEEDFYNLFGSQKRKASIAQVEKDANEKWARYDTKTCGGIQLLIDDVQVEIERITKREIKDFMDSTQATRVVVKMIQDELGTKKIDDKIVDLSTKVVVELFKTLWQRKGFWESALKSVR